MPSALPRRIGLWSAVAVLVGSTVGSGIFRSPAGIADRLPGPLPMLALWVFGGLVALCGALTLAEIASAYPETGGIYVYIREGWGRIPAFLFGWAELVIIRAAALGAIATTFAEYLLRSLGNNPSVAPYNQWVHYIAAISIAIMGILNYVGVKWGTLVQNWLTVLKCAGLLGIEIIALAALPHTGGHFTPVAPAGSYGFVAFALALTSVLWVYDGWADVSFVGGEVIDPERNLPKVLIYGTLAVIALYLLANIAYLSVLSIGEMRQSKLVAADVAQKLIGEPGVVAVGVIVMLSALGTLAGSMLTGPRILFAMATDGLLFRQLGRVQPRFQTPGAAILLATALGVIFVMLRSFEQLADTFVTAIIPFYALGVAAIFPLRRKKVGYRPAVKARWFPVAPVIFVLAILYLLGSALADPSARVATLAIFAVIFSGLIFYPVINRAAVR
ncbi:MAG: amino acid permease [Gemmatimonadaceae bacterium]